MNGIGNDLTGKVITNAYIQDIAEGKIPGRSIVFVFGSNPLVGAAYEDTWDNGGLTTNPTGGETWEIFSSSVNDTIAGTGARKVVVGFLDPNYDQGFIQEFEMDGETPIIFTGSDQFIFQAAVVIEKGSSPGNEGFITVRKAGGSSPADDRGGISIGENLSAYGSYTVPAGHVAYLYNVTANINKNEDIQTKFLVNAPTVDPDLFFRITEISLYQTTYNQDFIPSSLEAKATFRPQARSSDVIAIANVFYQMILVEDGF